MSSLHDFSLIQFETHLNSGNHVSLTLLSLKYVVQFFAYIYNIVEFIYNIIYINI